MCYHMKTEMSCVCSDGDSMSHFLIKKDYALLKCVRAEYINMLPGEDFKFLLTFLFKYFLKQNNEYLI